MKKVYLSNTETLDNVEYVLRDSFGNIKPIFNDNRLCQFLIKKGVISPFWMNYRYASWLMPLLGSMSDSKQVSNLITTAGRGLISGRINGAGSPAAATYIAVGTGATAAVIGDTTLQTETAVSGLARANGTVSTVTTTVTNDTSQITNTFTVTGTVAVTESGVLNAAAAGTLLCRQVFSAINVANGDSLQITWKIQNT